MKTLAELKKRLAELKAEGNTIVKAAEVAGGEFTAEQDEQFAAIEDEIEAVNADIAKAEKMQERRRSMEGLPAGGSPAPRTGGRNAVHDSDPALTGGFADIGEFAVAVHGAVRAGQVGGIVDERLGALTNTHEGGGSSGEGFLLPPQFQNNIWDLITPFDEFGPLIDEEPTSAREVKLTADETTPWGTAGIKAYWRAEGSKMEASKLADEGRNVPLHQLYCLATATEELLEDAMRLQNRLTSKAAMAIGWKKNLSIVAGTGVGQPLGWMNGKAALVVPKANAQAADTILPINVIEMYSRLLIVPGDKPFWLINQDCLPQLVTMTLGDKPIWMQPNGLADAPGGFLLGLPVRFSEFASTLGDKGDIQLVSPKGQYGVRRASGAKFATSIHLYFDYGVQAFRWTFRYGGQPHLSAPVMPFNGSATKSHVVMLAERA